MIVIGSQWTSLALSFVFKLFECYLFIICSKVSKILDTYGNNNGPKWWKIDIFKIEKHNISIREDPWTPLLNMRT